MEKPRKNTIVSVRLDAQQHAELSKYAESVNRSLSDFMRLAAKYMKDNKMVV